MRYMHEVYPSYKFYSILSSFNFDHNILEVLSEAIKCYWKHFKVLFDIVMFSYNYVKC